MEYVIGVILIIIVIAIGLLLFRKKIYDTVDYYENWKIDIMGRNIAAKITEVRRLNVSGEIKDQLTEWQTEWDHILLNDLANVEELLFDAERSADRFRIDKARKYTGMLEQIFVDIEKKIDQILSEVEEVIQTDEENRKEIEWIEPHLQQMRKHLSQNRYQYDRAAAQFEQKLDQMEEDVEKYYELIEEGIYSEASSIVDAMKDKLELIEKEMDDFPELYKEAKYELPSQLDELYKNYQALQVEGYNLDHLNLNKMVHDYQSRLLDYVIALEEEGTEKVKQALPETKENISEMNRLLKNETLAKNFVESKTTNFVQSLADLTEQFVSTKNEVEQLKKTYHFADENLEKYLTLEKQLKQLQDEKNSLLEDLDGRKKAYSILREQLTTSINSLANIEKEHDRFNTEIKNLRKDELEARKQIEQITEAMNEARRKLRQSNLPDIPKFVETMLEEANEKNEQVVHILNREPLDIPEIQKSLNEAKSLSENALNKTNTMLEQAELCELVIQYANRYRSRHSILAAKLIEAEELFRKAEYELALEQAVEAVEDVEPNALERIEKLHASIIV